MLIRSYLETLVGLLSTGNVLSCVWDDNDWKFVVVASEELLSSADDVPDDDSCSQRENQVLIVWMQNQSLFDVTCTNKELIKTQIRLRSNNGGGKSAVMVLNQEA